MFDAQDALQDAELDPDASPEDNIEILDGEQGAQPPTDRPRITTRCELVHVQMYSMDAGCIIKIA